MWPYHRVMIQKDADGMANSVARSSMIWVWMFAQAYLSENRIITVIT